MTKKIDFCEECKGLHKIRVEKISRKANTDQEIRKIEELVAQHCDDSNCILNPGNLWNKHIEKRTICAYCYSDPCTCDDWIPKQLNMAKPI